MLTPYIRTFIPFQPQPAQRIQDGLLRLRCAARLVGIFNTQQELAAVGAGKTQVKQGNIGSAYVGGASG